MGECAECAVWGQCGCSVGAVWTLRASGVVCGVWGAESNSLLVFNVLELGIGVVNLDVEGVGAVVVNEKRSVMFEEGGRGGEGRGERKR